MSFGDFTKGIEDIGKYYAQAEKAEEEQKKQPDKYKRLTKKTPTPNWQKFYSNKYISKYMPPPKDGPDIEDLIIAWQKGKDQRAQAKEWSEQMKKGQEGGYMEGPIGEPKGGPTVTKLQSPAEEAEFQAFYSDWAEKNKMNKDPNNPLHYYDYRGAWKEGQGPKEEGDHWPDTWKLPGHESFSNESMYYRPGMYAGRWEGEKYIPIGLDGSDIPMAPTGTPYGSPPEDIYSPSPYSQYPDIGYPMETGPLQSQYGGADMTNTEDANTLRTTSQAPRDLMGGPRLQPRWSMAANTAWEPSPRQPNWNWIV